MKTIMEGVETIAQASRARNTPEAPDAHKKGDDIVRFRVKIRGDWYKNEAALVHNVRLIDSPNAPRYAVAAHSCNLTFISGDGALGVTELNGGIEMIIKRPGPQTTSEPFNLNSFVSYKLRAVAAALNPSAGVILITHEKI